MTIHAIKHVFEEDGVYGEFSMALNQDNDGVMSVVFERYSHQQEWRMSVAQFHAAHSAWYELKKRFETQDD